MRAALDTLRAALTEIPPPPDPAAVLDEAATAWRETVRKARAAVSEEVRDGILDHRALAERRFGEVARSAMGDFLTWLEARCPFADGDPPAIPLPEIPDHGVVDLVGGLGGAGSALRTVEALAGRWMMEGDLVLAEWVLLRGEHPERLRARADRSALEAAIRDALDLIG